MQKQSKSIIANANAKSNQTKIEKKTTRQASKQNKTKQANQLNKQSSTHIMRKPLHTVSNVTVNPSTTIVTHDHCYCCFGGSRCTFVVVQRAREQGREREREPIAIKMCKLVGAREFARVMKILERKNHTNHKVSLKSSIFVQLNYYFLFYFFFFFCLCFCSLIQVTNRVFLNIENVSKMSCEIVDKLFINLYNFHKYKPAISRCTLCIAFFLSFVITWKFVVELSDTVHMCEENSPQTIKEMNKQKFTDIWFCPSKANFFWSIVISNSLCHVTVWKSRECDFVSLNRNRGGIII